MEFALTALIALLTVIGAVLVWNAHTSRGRRSLFRRRPEIPLEELYATFYSGSAIDKEEVAESLREIGKTLDLPPGKLRPSDRFREELAAASGWEFDDGMGILSAQAEQKLRMKGRDPQDLHRIETVDDYVRLTARPPNS